MAQVLNFPLSLLVLILNCPHTQHNLYTSTCKPSPTASHQAMNRNNEHVSAFLLAELGTSGSLDGQQRLVVKGRFLPKSFETVLRRYVNE